jgi:signal transduction histidine kinase
MSHELRTPLNSILLLSNGFIKNKSNNLNEKQIKHAEIINSQGMILLDLINDVLDLSKIEAGIDNFNIEKIEIEEYKVRFEDLFAHTFKKENLSLVISFNKDLPQYFISDILKIEQITRNLISNAIKFTKEGNITINFRRANETDLSEFKDKLILSVKDSGIGIKKEEHEMIFKPFAQADGGITREFGGTGLGLAISSKLSNLIGGEMRVKSEFGKGSEFLLIFPENLKTGAN